MIVPKHTQTAQKYLYAPKTQTMKRSILFVALLFTVFASCKNYEDFDFTGSVVDYEMCNGISEIGYAVALTSPDTIGGDYTTREMQQFHNVVVIYGSDRMLHSGDKISGRIYLDPGHSEAECNYHYNDRDVPEAVFTKLSVEK